VNHISNDTHVNTQSVLFSQQTHKIVVAGSVSPAESLVSPAGGCLDRGEATGLHPFF
jgi:hypothetical protein